MTASRFAAIVDLGTGEIASESEEKGEILHGVHGEAQPPKPLNAGC